MRALYRAMVALVTVAAFLSTTLFADISWADIARAFTPSGYPAIQPQDRPTIIHIQDAHCNYSCQRAIRDIIDELTRKYGIDLALVEGGAGDYDLSVFTDIRDKALREKVADYFVKEGRVNGAELFAITNPERLTLKGLEDPKLYKENLQAYRESLKFSAESGSALPARGGRGGKPHADEILNNIANRLNVLKSRLYPEGLKELEEKKEAYHDGKIELNEYVGLLREFSAEYGLDTTKYGNFRNISGMSEDEKTMDFKFANSERNQLIDNLTKRLSKGEVDTLVEKSVRFKERDIPQSEFYAYLFKKAKTANINLDEYPNLLKYKCYIEKYESLDKEALFKELEGLESDVVNKLCVNEGQRELYNQSKNLSILKKLFSFSITRDDYEYYAKNKLSLRGMLPTSAVSRSTSFINRGGWKHPEAISIESLDSYRETVDSFYELAFERDKAFVKNIESILNADGRISNADLRGYSNDNLRESALDMRESAFNNKNIIIVTGGFHAENLKRLIEEKGYNYVSIMPQFETKTEDTPYFKLLSGRLSPIEEEIKNKAANLAVGSPLGGLGEPISKEAVAQVRASIENGTVPSSAPEPSPRKDVTKKHYPLFYRDPEDIARRVLIGFLGRIKQDGSPLKGAFGDVIITYWQVYKYTNNYTHYKTLGQNPRLTEAVNLALKQFFALEPEKAPQVADSSIYRAVMELKAMRIDSIKIGKNTYGERALISRIVAKRLLEKILHRTETDPEMKGILVFSYSEARRMIGKKATYAMFPRDNVFLRKVNEQLNGAFSMSKAKYRTRRAGGGILRDLAIALRQKGVFTVEIRKVPGVHYNSNSYSLARKVIEAIEEKTDWTGDIALPEYIASYLAGGRPRQTTLNANPEIYKEANIWFEKALSQKEPKRGKDSDDHYWYHRGKTLRARGVNSIKIVKDKRGRKRESESYAEKLRKIEQGSPMPHRPLLMIGWLWPLVVSALWKLHVPDRAIAFVAGFSEEIAASALVFGIVKAGEYKGYWETSFWPLVFFSLFVFLASFILHAASKYVYYFEDDALKVRPREEEDSSFIFWRIATYRFFYLLFLYAVPVYTSIFNAYFFHASPLTAEIANFLIPFVVIGLLHGFDNLFSKNRDPLLMVGPNGPGEDEAAAGGTPMKAEALSNFQKVIFEVDKDRGSHEEIQSQQAIYGAFSRKGVADNVHPIAGNTEAGETLNGYDGTNNGSTAGGDFGSSLGMGGVYADTQGSFRRYDGSSSAGVQSQFEEDSPLFASKAGMAYNKSILRIYLKFWHWLERRYKALRHSVQRIFHKDRAFSFNGQELAVGSVPMGAMKEESSIDGHSAIFVDLTNSYKQPFSRKSFFYSLNFMLHFSHLKNNIAYCLRLCKDFLFGQLEIHRSSKPMDGFPADSAAPDGATEVVRRTKDPETEARNKFPGSKFYKTPENKAHTAELSLEEGSRNARGLRRNREKAATEGKALLMANKGIPICFYILENLLYEPFGYIFTFVVGHNRASSIGVLEIDVDSALPEWLKTQLLKYLDDDGGFKRDKPHLVISTSWRPMNLRRGISFSTSRQRRITSFILLSKVGSVLACVWQPFNEDTDARNMPSSSLSMITGNIYLCMPNLLPFTIYTLLLEVSQYHSIFGARTAPRQKSARSSSINIVNTEEIAVTLPDGLEAAKAEDGSDIARIFGQTRGLSRPNDDAAPAKPEAAGPAGEGEPDAEAGQPKAAENAGAKKTELFPSVHSIKIKERRNRITQKLNEPPPEGDKWTVQSLAHRLNLGWKTVYNDLNAMELLNSERLDIEEKPTAKELESRRDLIRKKLNEPPPEGDKWTVQSLAHRLNLGWRTVYNDLKAIDLLNSERLDIKEIPAHEEIESRRDLIRKKLNEPPPEGDKWTVQSLAHRLNLGWRTVCNDLKALGLLNSNLIYINATGKLRESWRSLASFEETVDVNGLPDENAALFELLERVLNPVDYEFIINDMLSDESIEDTAVRYNVDVSEVIRRRIEIHRKIGIGLKSMPYHSGFEPSVHPWPSAEPTATAQIAPDEAAKDVRTTEDPEKEAQDSTQGGETGGEDADKGEKPYSLGAAAADDPSVFSKEVPEEIRVDKSEPSLNELLRQTFSFSTDIFPTEQVYLDDRIAFAMIKPDGKDCRDNIIMDFVEAGFEIVSIVVRRGPVDERTLRKLYSKLKDEEFFESLIRYVGSGEIALIVLRGEKDAYKSVRKMLGKWDGSEAGTLRHKYGVIAGKPCKNKIHASDNPQDVSGEISIMFTDKELSKIFRNENSDNEDRGGSRAGPETDREPLKIRKDPWQGKYTNWEEVRAIMPDLVKPEGGVIDKPRFPAQDEINKLSPLVKGGNRAAKELLMLTHDGLLHKIARRIMGLNAGLGLNYNDLFEAGKHGVGSSIRGLERAIELYEPEKGTKFTTYAYMAIMRTMNKHVAQIRRSKEKCSLDTPIGMDAEETFSGSTRDEGRIDTQKEAENRLDADAIMEILNGLSVSDRNKEIFIRRAVNGEKLREIGASYGIKKERVRQIAAWIVRKIRYELCKLPDKEKPLFEKDTFSQRYKSERIKAGVTQNGLSKTTGIANIWKYETGRIPGPSNMKKLAEAFKTTVSYLLTGLDEEKLMGLPIEDVNNPIHRKTLGLMLKLLRYKKVLTIKEASILAGIYYPIISDLENGETPLSPAYLVRLEGVYGKIPEKIKMAVLKRGKRDGSRAEPTPVPQPNSGLPPTPVDSTPDALEGEDADEGEERHSLGAAAADDENVFSEDVPKEIRVDQSVAGEAEPAAAGGPKGEAATDGRCYGERKKIRESLAIVKALSSPTKVTFVMPMYEEEVRLRPKTAGNLSGEDALRKKVGELEALRRVNNNFEWRIIAVDDNPAGSSAECVEEIKTEIERESGREVAERIKVEIISPKTKALGSKKGGAVLKGFEEALKDSWADYIGYTDTDISTDLRQTGLLLESLCKGKAEVAIGSRWRKGAYFGNVPLSGIVSSKIYNWCVHLILRPLADIKDTQRGFKLFGRNVLKHIFPHAQDVTFAFDTELLLLSKLSGYRVEEVPIAWIDSPQERKLNAVKEARNMLLSLLKQRRHMKSSRKTRDGSGDEPTPVPQPGSDLSPKPVDSTPDALEGEDADEGEERHSLGAAAADDENVFSEKLPPEIQVDEAGEGEPAAGGAKAGKKFSASELTQQLMDMGLAVRLEGNRLFLPIKSYLEMVKDIFLANEVKVGSQMVRETHLGFKPDMANFDRNGVQVNGNEAAIANHNIADFPPGVVQAQSRSKGSQEERNARAGIDIGLGFQGDAGAGKLDFNDGIIILPIFLIGENNLFHNICINSSGPGTGNHIGVWWGYLFFALSTASSPVNISPWQITTFWRGYFPTNFSKFSLTNVSLSNFFFIICFTSPFMYTINRLESQGNTIKGQVSTLDKTGGKTEPLEPKSRVRVAPPAGKALEGMLDPLSAAMQDAEKIPASPFATPAASPTGSARFHQPSSSSKDEPKEPAAPAAGGTEAKSGKPADATPDTAKGSGEAGRSLDQVTVYHATTLDALAPILEYGLWTFQNKDIVFDENRWKSSGCENLPLVGWGYVVLVYRTSEHEFYITQNMYPGIATVAEETLPEELLAELDDIVVSEDRNSLAESLRDSRRKRAHIAPSLLDAEETLRVNEDLYRKGILSENSLGYLRYLLRNENGEAAICRNFDETNIAKIPFSSIRRLMREGALIVHNNKFYEFPVSDDKDVKITLAKLKKHIKLHDNLQFYLRQNTKLQGSAPYLSIDDWHENLPVIADMILGKKIVADSDSTWGSFKFPNLECENEFLKRVFNLKDEELPETAAYEEMTGFNPFKDFDLEQPMAADPATAENASAETSGNRSELPRGTGVSSASESELKEELKSENPGVIIGALRRIALLAERPEGEEARQAMEKLRALATPDNIALVGQLMAHSDPFVVKWAKEAKNALALVVSDAYITTAGERMREILVDAPTVEKPCTIGLVIKADSKEGADEVLLKQLANEWSIIARKVEPHVLKKRGILETRPAGADNRNIRYVICVDDGTDGRLENFRQALEAQGNPKERTFAFVLSNETRGENNKAMRALSEVAYLVGLRGEVVPVSWQMLAAPIFVNLIASKYDKDANEKERINALVDALIEDVSLMTNVNVETLKASALGEKLEDLRAATCGQLANLLNGLAIILDLPPIEAESAKIQKADQALQRSL